MKSDTPVSEWELEPLIERGRTIRRVPDVVRARALARARVTVAAERARQPAARVAGASKITASAALGHGRRRGLRTAVAASVALILGAAGAGAALRVWTPRPIEPASAPTSRATFKPRVATLDTATPPAPEPAPIARPRHVARTVTPQESYRAELDLLQRAQVAYAGRDFSGALVLLAEHARRFPKGRLAEEREALRIRSLAGSGREDEARRATAAFGVRFPRSVLLLRLQQTAGAAD
jgi:hypothetical protein